MRAANHVLPSLVAAEHFGARCREAIACYLETGNPAFRDAAVYYATQAASFVPATDYECAECGNICDTFEEAEACCTAQGALIEDEPNERERGDDDGGDPRDYRDGLED